MGGVNPFVLRLGGEWVGGRACVMEYMQTLICLCLWNIGTSYLIQMWCVQSSKIFVKPCDVRLVIKASTLYRNKHTKTLLLF